MSDRKAQENRCVWFDIPVADLERARAFYSAVLGIGVAIETAGNTAFGVLEHQQGNGGCLVVAPEQIDAGGGPLLYLGVDGRIRDAVVQAEAHGGRLREAVTPIGAHGFRAIVIDSEGNRIALHSHADA